ncbi:aminotransferase class V-fold PLP-dependent enzyme [Mucisphaera calidilacus]|nr:aminotransferase class V-fold PLP-dependent enzyme [Mucisphaera calidilacus]
MSDPHLFPALSAMVHLNHAGVAPVCGPAAEAMAKYGQEASTLPYSEASWYSDIKDLRSLTARLINARGPDEIAFVPNTSTGLATVARGLDWRRGDQVVITDVEYPANRYPWEDLGRFGVELVEVKQHADGRIDVEDVCNAITDRTRVVSLSHVQYGSGHRIDLRPISETVHRAGGYLCVDAIQSVGVLPVDVRSMGIDFLAADGHKWMLGPEGAGIFYVHEDLCEMLHPPVVGWLNMVNAQDYGNYEYRFVRDARRFEPGTWNVPGLLGLRAAIGLLLEVGIERVWERVEGLTTRVAEGAAERGYGVFSPRRLESERSGSVVIEARASEEAGALVKRLAEQKIYVALRNGRVRVSPHFYNTPEQIDRLLEAL